MKSFLKEFKDFAVKGNMVDIAIGVIIGTAFNKIIDVLVKEVIMPPLSVLTGDTSLEKKSLILKEAVYENGEQVKDAIAIGYGKLIDVSIDFLIICFTIFIIVKIMNSLKTKAEDTKNKSVKTPKDIELLNQIADSLERQNEILQAQESKN